MSKQFVIGLWQGIALYPLWRWLHQTTCRHERRTQEQNKYEVCIECGKELK